MPSSFSNVCENYQPTPSSLVTGKRQEEEGVPKRKMMKTTKRREEKREEGIEMREKRRE
jgi:hypothetical protein